MNSLPGMGRAASGISDVGIGRRQEQQDLGLHRIGVLELVDEDAPELLLQVAPDRGVGSDQRRACASADRRNRGAPASCFSSWYRAVAPASSCWSAAARSASACFRNCAGARRTARRARRAPPTARSVLAVLGAEALSRARQAAIAREVDEPRFPAVEVDLAERLLEPNLLAQAADGVGIDEQVVAIGRRARREIGQRDAAAAIKRSISPARSNGGRCHGRGKSRHSASVRPARAQAVDRAVGIAA